MANKVAYTNLKNGDYIFWIQDETGTKVTKEYKANIEETCYSNNLLKLVSANRLVKTVQIINIHTLKTLAKRFYYGFLDKDTFELCGDYAYFDPLTQILYDCENNIVASDVADITSYIPEHDLLLITHSNQKRSIIKKGVCVLTDLEEVDLSNKYTYVIKDCVLSYYDNSNMKCIATIPLTNCHKCIFKAINYMDIRYVNIRYMPLLFISYYNEYDICTKKEIRNVDDPTKVIEIDKKSSVRCRGLMQGIEYIEIHDTKTSQTKIFDHKNWRFLSNSSVSEIKHLHDRAGKIQLWVLIYPDKTHEVYSKDLNLLFKLRLTDIKLSKNEDFLILENMDFKGIASLDGEILLKPIASALEEDLDAFYYRTFDSSIGTILKNRKTESNNDVK